MPASTVTGTLRGTITDAHTGEPVWEATVSVAGVHSATYHDGYFYGHAEVVEANPAPNSILPGLLH